MKTRLRFSVVLELCHVIAAISTVSLLKLIHKLNSFISEGIIICKMNMRRRFYKMPSANILCVCGALYLSVKDVFHLLDMSPLPFANTLRRLDSFCLRMRLHRPLQRLSDNFFSIFICSCSILISSCGTLLYKHRTSGFGNV